PKSVESSDQHFYTVMVQYHLILWDMCIQQEILEWTRVLVKFMRPLEYTSRWVSKLKRK
ncbi:37888_t:CDS:1, partial [Gigaspora margarita]